MAFAVRTNVKYDGSVDDDAPVHGHAVSFNVREFLHIKEVGACIHSIERYTLAQTVNFLVAIVLQSSAFVIGCRPSSVCRL